MRIYGSVCLCVCCECVCGTYMWCICRDTYTRVASLSYVYVVYMCVENEVHDICVNVYVWHMCFIFLKIFKDVYMCVGV